MWYWEVLDTLLIVSIFSEIIERKVEGTEFGVLKKCKRTCEIVVWEGKRVKV